MNLRLIGSSKLICDLIRGQKVHADLDKGKTQWQQAFFEVLKDLKFGCHNVEK